MVILETSSLFGCAELETLVPYILADYLANGKVSKERVIQLAVDNGERKEEIEWCIKHDHSGGYCMGYEGLVLDGGLPTAKFCQNIFRRLLKCSKEKKFAH